jgi:ribosomal protein L25 (general stress protein Ctc)
MYKNALSKELIEPKKYNTIISLSDDGEEIIIMKKKYANHARFSLETPKMNNEYHVKNYSL